MLYDAKHYPFATIERGVLSRWEPVDLMSFRLTLNDAMTIHHAISDMKAVPFQLYKQVPPRLENLIGVSINKGWMQKVKQRHSAIERCTHFLERLKVIATTAYQTIHPYRIKDSHGSKLIHPSIVDQCQGFDLKGAVVKTYFPEFANSED
jgi:hypothetical protein